MMVKRGPGTWPHAQEGEAQHGHFAGLGRFGQGDEHLPLWMTQAKSSEVKVASEHEAVLAVLKNLGLPLQRIGVEAGPLSGNGGSAFSPKRALP